MKTLIFFITSALLGSSLVRAAIIRDVTTRSHGAGTESPFFDSFDLDEDGNYEFLMGIGGASGPSTISGLIAPTTTAFFREVNDGFPSRVIPLPIGSSVGPQEITLNRNFFSLPKDGRLILTSRFSGEPDDGPFVGLTAALGFRFEKEGSTHYGYALITNASAGGLTVLETAWEDEPDTAITVIPEPTTLSCLLFSVFALTRRKR